MGAVTERNAAEWMAYYADRRNNPNAKPPKTHLMGLPDLLKSVRRPYSAGNRSNAVGVAISDYELCWLGRFHENIRNQLVHFEPLGWSIEVSGIPEIAKLIARIIEDILRIDWAFRHLDLAKHDEMQRSLRVFAKIEWPA